MGGRVEAWLDRMLGYPVERHRFRRKLGYAPSLLRPRSYNEKIVWRKLFDRNPLFPRVTDKWLVRGYIVERLGQAQAEQYLPPVLAVLDKAEQLQADSLKQPCVIKPTHSSGRVILLPEGLGNSRQWTLSGIQKECRRWFREPPYHSTHHEWAYQTLKPRLMVESFIGEANTPAPDYKFLVFHGRIRLIQVHLGRFAESQRQEFDMDWRPVHETRDLPEADRLSAPEQLGTMARLAQQLAAPFDFMRVDMYCVAGRIYLGELTCYPASGRRLFVDPSMDFHLGEYWRLPGREIVGIRLPVGD
nr:ATP-grasp fold amidoligase family protein [Natronospira proteinivora]